MYFDNARNSCISLRVLSCDCNGFHLEKRS
uniref:Uncharacterized protein n=1 Tax=Arundo donax TaxID=35708 RepID=A0A0A9BYT8_ARUDO